MPSANCWVPVVLDALLIGWLVAMWRDRARTAARVRHARAQLADAAPCAECEPELTTLGVYYHPGGEQDPMRALLDAERIGRDTVSVILSPVDGSDQAAINMPRATVEPFREMLAKARDQEVRHG